MTRDQPLPVFISEGQRSRRWLQSTSALHWHFRIF